MCLSFDTAPFCVYFIVVFISLPYCQKDVGRINLYDNGLCVYLLFGSSALPSP